MKADVSFLIQTITLFILTPCATAVLAAVFLRWFSLRFSVGFGLFLSAGASFLASCTLFMVIGAPDSGWRCVVFYALSGVQGLLAAVGTLCMLRAVWRRTGGTTGNEKTSGDESAD